MFPNSHLYSYHFCHSHQFQYPKKPLFKLQSSTYRLLRSILDFWIFFLRTYGGIMFLSIVVKIFNLEDIVSLLLNDIGICTYCKEVITTILSLTPSVPRTSLVVLVFLVNLALMDERLLIFVTRFISGSSVSELSFSRFLLLVFCRSFPLGTL